MSPRASRSAARRSGRRAFGKRARRAVPPPGRRRRLRWAIAVAGVAGVAVLAVIAGGRSTSGAGAPARVTAAPGSPTTSFAHSGRVGERLATYSLTSIDGAPVRVPAGKPGAVYFMAGWCGTCVAEAGALGRLQRHLGDRIAVVAVSPDPSDSVSAIRRLRTAAGRPRYPFVWDEGGTLARALQVSALDTTLVYDADGRVVYRDAVPTDLATLRAAFRRAGVS
jgi:thiol-disulfide isomerase/thioredoxin